MNCSVYTSILWFETTMVKNDCDYDSGIKKALNGHRQARDGEPQASLSRREPPLPPARPCRLRRTQGFKTSLDVCLWAEASSATTLFLHTSLHPSSPMMDEALPYPTPTSNVAVSNATAIAFS